MKYLGEVSIDRVLLALADCPEATKTEARKHPHWYEWIFDRTNLGTIHDQDKTDPMVGPVAVIHQYRVPWMSTAAGAQSREKHERFLSMLARGEDFGWLVIHRVAGLSDRHILDGAHRIHAAYQFAQRQPNLAIKLYWTLGS
jgi:hypothetical protein